MSATILRETEHQLQGIAAMLSRGGIQAGDYTLGDLNDWINLRVVVRHERLRVLLVVTSFPEEEA